jgi:hypothetical protein
LNSIKFSGTGWFILDFHASSAAKFKIASNDTITASDELQRIWKRSLHILRYFPERSEENHENLSG